MDTLGALALATEPPTDRLMHRSPVGRRFGLIGFLSKQFNIYGTLNTILISTKTSMHMYTWFLYLILVNV